MDLITAQAMAVREMTRHGLMELGWTFSFDRATSRLGQTDFSKKRITISKHFTGAATVEQFEQTLIHEMAHALLPISAKHGALWKAKAKSLGYKGARTARNPYYEQKQAEKRAVIAARRPVGGRTSVGPVERVLVTALETTAGTPKVGDMLTLPAGQRLKVTEVGTRQTKAVEIGSGNIWNLTTADAYRFMKG